jgi:hypothetical protein
MTTSPFRLLFRSARLVQPIQKVFGRGGVTETGASAYPRTMSDRSGRDPDPFDEFKESQDGDYEPGLNPFDADDLPIDLEPESFFMDDDRSVPLDDGEDD